MSRTKRGALMRPLRRGVCRYCGCTQNNPCFLAGISMPGVPVVPLPCSWRDKSQAVCTNPRCITAHRAVVSAHKATRQARLQIFKARRRRSR